MAKNDLNTSAPSHDRTKFQCLQVAEILNRMQEYVDNIKQQSERIVSLGFGGAALASQPDERGEPKDLAGFHIFDTIVDTAGEHTTLRELKDAIAELTLRTKVTQ